VSGGQDGRDIPLTALKSGARNLLESISMEVGTAVTNAMSYRDAVEAADQDPVTGC
jgi:GAF domain-containing protein